jgi:hypothetical protein
LRTLVTYLPALTCGAMMLFMCIPMMRNMHKGRDGTADIDRKKEIAELREEIQRLKSDSTNDVTTKESV